MSDLDKKLNEQIQKINESTGVPPPVAKILLKHFRWQTSEIVERMRNDTTRTLIEARIEPKSNVAAAQSLATTLNNNNTPAGSGSRHAHSYALRSKVSVFCC